MLCLMEVTVVQNFDAKDNLKKKLFDSFDVTPALHT